MARILSLSPCERGWRIEWQRDASGEGSSLHLPIRFAVRSILQHDTLREKLVADAIGFFEVLRFARGVASSYESLDFLVFTNISNFVTWRKLTSLLVFVDSKELQS